MNQTGVENDDSTIAILLKHPCHGGVHRIQCLVASEENLPKAAKDVYAYAFIKRNPLLQPIGKIFRKTFYLKARREWINISKGMQRTESKRNRAGGGAGRKDKDER